jgi:hypothetical protein
MEGIIVGVDESSRAQAASTSWITFPPAADGQPRTGHTKALTDHPNEWERRVVSFLTGALAVQGRDVWPSIAYGGRPMMGP